MYSKLIKQTVESPNYSSRNGKTVKKITIHHAAGVLSGVALANIFKDVRRQASCNYAIGKDGEIIGVVPEEKRSWCSGSRPNDEEAICIEVSNCKGKPNWEVSETVMNSLIELCVDICKRYNIQPYYDGTKNGTFTFHCMFQATECPGRYIKTNINCIIDKIKIGMGSTNIEKPIEEPHVYKDLYKVKVTCKDLNIRAGAGTKYKTVGHITDQGVYTIIEEKNGWGKLKSGAGWICLRYTKKI